MKLTILIFCFLSVLSLSYQESNDTVIEAPKDFEADHFRERRSAHHHKHGNKVSLTNYLVGRGEISRLIHSNGLGYMGGPIPYRRYLKRKFCGNKMALLDKITKEKSVAR